MRRAAIAAALLLALALAWSPAPAAAQACTDSNGTFRFLNDAFPPLSTNGPVFTGQLVVANADGPVTFSVDPNSPDPLPAGLTLDPSSGRITGLATQASNKTVRFRADDTLNFITRDVDFSISSSGGGGNGGSGVSNPNFPDGRVGVAYSHPALSPSGDGPYTFGGSDLPPGLTMDGASGQITGTPTAAGRFFISLTIYDAAPGEENVGTSVVPIVIHPADAAEPPTYDFEFVTQFLNNGEVGTSYCDQYLTSGAAAGGTVTFGASGLPAGLLLDSATGAVTGAPAEPGTFLVTITANDGTATISTNLSMIVAPGPTADFHWNFLGLPAALENTLYDRQPPISISAEGANGGISYAATGLPAGITYSASTGELSGTPTKKGEYPVTLTATDAGNDDVITLDLVFVVLPTAGGDVSRIVVNFWVTKAALKIGTDGSESWKSTALYNADRRAGNRFDPATDVFRATIGSRVVQVDPGECVGSLPDQDCSFATARGVVPAEKVRITPDKQTLTWSTGSDTLAETVPGSMAQTVVLGDSTFRLPLHFDTAGKAKPALDFERTAFVLRKGAITLRGAGADGANLGLLLADPSFAYEPGVSTLRVRVLEGATVLVDRDFTALGGLPKLGTDTRTGKPWVFFKTLSDPETTNRVVMSYSSKTGAMKLVLSSLDLTALSNGVAELTIEVTIGSRVYPTEVTFFEPSDGKYNLAIP